MNSGKYVVLCVSIQLKFDVAPVNGVKQHLTWQQVYFLPCQQLPLCVYCIERELFFTSGTIAHILVQDCFHCS